MIPKKLFCQIVLFMLACSILEWNAAYGTCWEAVCNAFLLVKGIVLIVAYERGIVA